MRIILVNQYYGPDVAPTARYLEDLARALAARGHEVRVACSRRAYTGERHPLSREQRDGVQVRRLPAFGFGRATHAGRVLDYASFYVSLAIYLCATRPRPALIICLTTPPYTGLLGRIAAGLRRCAHAHWIMDVYPDVLVAHGMLHRRGILHRLFSWLTRISLHGSALTLTIGPDMAGRVASGTDGSGHAPARWIPLWIPSGFRQQSQECVNALRASRGWTGEETVFLYSGNMGLGHRIAEFLEAARRWISEGGRLPICVAFAGGGRKQTLVQSFMSTHPEAPISLMPYADDDQLAAHLASADVLLLSLDHAWVGCLLPSKIQTAFASGRPVLFVGPADCTPARWIAESGAGWVVAPDDGNGLLQAMQECCFPEERARRAAQAVAFARKYFDADQNIATMCELIESVPQNAGPAE